MPNYTFRVSIDIDDHETIEETLADLRRRLYAGFLPNFTIDYGEDSDGNEWDGHELNEMLETLPMPWEENRPTDEEDTKNE